MQDTLEEEKDTNVTTTSSFMFSFPNTHLSEHTPEWHIRTQTSFSLPPPPPAPKPQPIKIGPLQILLAINQPSEALDD